MVVDHAIRQPRNAEQGCAPFHHVTEQFFGSDEGGSQTLTAAAPLVVALSAVESAGACPSSTTSRCTGVKSTETKRRLLRIYRRPPPHRLHSHHQQQQHAAEFSC